MHLFWSGVLIGWGIAIPIGPLNVEMIRRNLAFGARYGVGLGIGATLADITFLLLMMSGLLLFLNQPAVLAIIGFLGALVLLYFAYRSFTAGVATRARQLRKEPVWKSVLSGYAMAGFNPISIMFWLSISANIVSLSQHAGQSFIIIPLGVMCGTLSWSMSLNTVLFFTRHKIGERVMRGLNILGGIILTGFALVGIIHAISLFASA